jgi:DNA processing protein
LVEFLTPAERQAEVRALLVLDQIPGIGLKTLAALVARFASGRAALAAPERAFSALAGRRAAAARRDSEIHERVTAGLKVAERLHCVVLTWSDAEYPSMLRDLADPPPVLFLWGRAELLSTPRITIVGARKATARARDFAQRLASALARSGYTVVSGMALGIDGRAHVGALDACGGTIAVLGRGPDRAYPASHGRLFRDIVASGLVVSEFLPGTPALPYHFPRRNRVLAAIGQAVVVVEASRRSGALITVEHALDLGVDVYAVPGPVDQTTCEGSNALLADGARPLVSVERFLQDLGVESVAASDRLLPGGDEGLLLVGLDRGPAHVEELAAMAGLGVSDALALLAELEVDGWVEQRPGLRFERAS